ncbi:MAG: sugar ABC transporter ATP-binding protein [Planctomycetes bacterium]|nr:sugar ABC transporter ATP-binding protein [Planctomycetota bacterium]
MSQDESKRLLIDLRCLSKRFPGVQALLNVDLQVARGEVLAVIGENGAGKSTLMKILAGVQMPDEGQILIDGSPVRIANVRQATELGIALIHQELNLSDNLDVGANIYLGREPLKAGLIDRRRIAAQAEQYLDMVGLDCSPRTIVSHLSIGQQQMVEIAKALSADARILIMDEPTSSLSSRETDRLFEVIGQLRDRGVSIVYISHRLGEVREIADRVSVLRDGENAGELAKSEITHDNMVRLMVGRDISQFYVRTPHEVGKTVLRVEGLRVPGRAEHAIDFSVRAGEIVGMAGLVGAGRTELLQVLFGVDRAERGTIRIDGKLAKLSSPLDAIRCGVSLVPEDRKQAGLIMEMSVRENLSLASLRRDQRGGLLNRTAEQNIARDMIQRLAIRTPGAEQTVQYLSGGNQQKVVLGKWLAMRPRVLLMDEPTRGVDVGAKQEIYRMMERLASKGVAILFVSSEMEEILNMSDRALVMHEGRIAGELSRDQLSEESIMQLATGNILAA